MNWISVKDRLPESGVPVLVTYVGYNDKKLYADGIANINYGEWCWWEGFNEENDEKVLVTITHWIPLPEPPKSGGPKCGVCCEVCCEVC